jgi:methyl-accepting chemotaxis protein
MAESLNTMADHKATFVHWWQASMKEAIALRDLHQTETAADREEAADELRAAAISKVQQLNAIRGQLLRQVNHILEASKRIKSGHQGAAVQAQTQILEDSARGISTLLQVTAGEGER